MGHGREDHTSDWTAIVLGPVFLFRWLHMLLGSFLTTSMCIIAAGAFYLLRSESRPEARIMLNGACSSP
jgi:cytochrome bd-type quinol oxidase subunit 1